MADDRPSSSWRTRHAIKFMPSQLFLAGLYLGLGAPLFLFGAPWPATAALVAAGLNLALAIGHWRHLRALLALALLALGCRAECDGTCPAELRIERGMHAWARELLFACDAKLREQAATSAYDAAQRELGVLHDLDAEALPAADWLTSREPVRDALARARGEQS